MMSRALRNLTAVSLFGFAFLSYGSSSYGADSGYYYYYPAYGGCYYYYAPAPSPAATTGQAANNSTPQTTAANGISGTVRSYSADPAATATTNQYYNPSQYYYPGNYRYSYASSGRSWGNRH